MRYRPFSDPKNIDKMVRQIVVFLEEATLEVNILPWDGDPFVENIGHWVKYVSTESKSPTEVYLYWDRKTENVFLAKVKKRLDSEKGYFDQLDRYFQDAYQKFKDITDTFFQRGVSFYQNCSDKELVALFHELNACNQYPLSAYYMVYDLVNLLTVFTEKEVKSVFARLRAGNPKEIFIILSTTAIDTVIKTERVEFLKKLKRIQKIYHEKKDWQSKKIQSLIFKQWYDFGPCVYTHAENRTYALDDYRKKFRKNISLDTVVLLTQIHVEAREERRKVQRALACLEEFPRLISSILQMRKMLGYRNREAEYYDAYFDHCLDFFDEIARRLRIALDDVWLLSKGEIVSGLQNTNDTRAIVKERKKKGFTIKQVGDEIKVWTGVKKEDWHEHKHHKVTHFEGSVAYEGKVVGKARVIFNPREEGSTFQKGEILVTSMTTPDFVPLMKRARAVITDEGGLLCHAAIVARELQKPCIIGTRIATKVLRNGDKVEVDANKGVVRILEK